MAQKFLKTDRCSIGFVGLDALDAINDNFEELYDIFSLTNPKLLKTDRCLSGYSGIAGIDAINDNFTELWANSGVAAEEQRLLKGKRGTNGYVGLAALDAINDNFTDMYNDGGAENGYLVDTTAEFNALTLNNGDIVRFKRGNTFELGGISIINNDITLSAYGDGADPILIGSTSLSDATWTSEAGGYYSTPLLTAPKWVYKDGIEARQGESDWIRVVSKTNNTTLVCTTAVLQAYNSVQSLVGAKLRGKEFDFRYSYENTIATYNGTNTITLSIANTGFAADTGFRLYGQKQFATQEGDWWYDDVNNKLWIKTTTTPAGTDIRVCTQDYAFNLDEVTGTTITGLEFTQYYRTAVNAFHATNTSISDFYIHDIRTNGLWLYGNATNINVSNGEIERCGLNGIFFGALSQSTFDTLDIHDIGMRSNYGWPLDTYWRKTGGTAICHADDQNETVKLADSITVSNCHLYNLAYQGINAHGSTHIFEYLQINNFCNRFQDGGGIHTFYRDDFGAGEFTRNGIIRNCIIYDGHGNNEGLTNWRIPVATGIYFDAGTKNWEVRDCVIYNNSWFGVYANWNSQQSKLYNNIIANNGSSMGNVTFYEIPDSTNSPNYLSNNMNVLEGNTIVSSSSQYAVASMSDGPNHNATYNPFSGGGSSNNNTYFNLARSYTSTTNPVVNSSICRYADSASEFASIQSTSAYSTISLAGWRTRNGGDAGSTANGFYLDPMKGAGEQVIVLANPTNSSVLIDAPDNKYNDLAGVTLNDATVGPWTAIIGRIKAAQYYLMEGFVGTSGANITSRAPMIGPTANVLSGTHTINTNNKLASSVAGLISWNVGTPNYIYEFVMRASNAAGMLRGDIRYADNTTSVTHRLIVDITTATGVRLRENNDSGSLVTLATTPFTLVINTDYLVKIIANGSNVKIYIDNILYIDTTVNVVTGNYVALFSDNSTSVNLTDSVVAYSL